MALTTTFRTVTPLLQVGNLNLSVDFYINKLGFGEAWREDNGFVILYRDEIEVYLSIAA